MPNRANTTDDERAEILRQHIRGLGKLRLGAEALRNIRLNGMPVDRVITEMLVSGEVVFTGVAVRLVTK
ncbi:MAG: hypothetical protein WCB12_14115 [Bryobacteraceae bacterium]